MVKTQQCDLDEILKIECKVIGPNRESGGKFKDRFGEHYGGNGGIGGFMSRVGEGKGKMGGGSLDRCSMVSNDRRGGGGLVVSGGRSSR
nr:hypothetical protein [Tanacetum cinerariifolium]